jgi:hypothetical protein
MTVSSVLALVALSILPLGMEFQTVYPMAKANSSNPLARDEERRVVGIIR